MTTTTRAAQLSVSLNANPLVDAWVRVDLTETVTVFSGKVDIGQGLRTALAAIAAEELDVAIERVRVVMADTELTPNEMYTASSQSIEDSGGALRQAAAEARQHILSLASAALDSPIESLSVADGKVESAINERCVTYWELMGGRPFQRMVTGNAPLKVSANHLPGRVIRRIDLAARVFGEPCFVQDLRLPGMLFGRVLRPPSQSARLRSIDLGDLSEREGIVDVVVDGSFVGVVAEREFDAVRAVSWLRGRAVWDEESVLPAMDQVTEYLRSHVSHSLPIIDGVAVAGSPEPFHTADDSVRRSYSRPYLLHGALGPSAAVAQFADGRLRVWTHNQGVFPLAGALAELFALPLDRVRVSHVDGAGSFGHGGAEDAACDAAMLARRVSPSPVSLQWSREDEHTWEPFGPAMAVDLCATLGPNKEIAFWSHEVWSTTHLARAVPGGNAAAFVAASHLHNAKKRPAAKPWTGAPHLGAHRNADPLYAFPRKRVVEHFVSESPVRTSTLRSLGAYPNVFAIESFMDELAEHVGENSVEFRLRHLRDERARTVLRKLADVGRWDERGQWERASGKGRGLALAQYKNSKAYVGVCVDVELDDATCEVRLSNAVVVADAGRVVDLDGLVQQLEGGFIQSASWTLKERVTFDSTRITSCDWESYPILRCRDIPSIRTIVLDDPSLPSVGAGEAAQGPTVAAISNALAYACGLRLRDLPFTPSRVRHALLADA